MNEFKPGESVVIQNYARNPHAWINGRTARVLWCDPHSIYVHITLDLEVSELGTEEFPIIVTKEEIQHV